MVIVRMCRQLVKLRDKRQRRVLPVVYVNRAYTSQTCSRCGHRAKANRKSQAHFLCVGCGFSAHADLNAANIARRAVYDPSRHRKVMWRDPKLFPFIAANSKLSCMVYNARLLNLSR
jgi:transposase